MEATIVSLIPSDENSASFQDAFGEFSEAKGRGRARRQKRKMGRIDNKQERRVARKTNRQTNRATRKQAHLDKRQARNDARSQRQLTRAQTRQDKKDMKAYDDLNREAAEKEQEMAYEDQETDMSQDGSGDYDQQGGGDYDTQQGGGYGESQTNSQPQYQEEPQYQQQSYSLPQQQVGQGSYDDGEEWGGQPDYSQFGWGESDGGDYGFNGEDTSSLDGGEATKIDSKISDIANKIEWHKELVTRLEKRAEKLNSRLSRSSDHNQRAMINMNLKDTVAKIEQSKKRVSELEAKLSSYSTANGGFDKRRDRHVRMALRNARGNRRGMLLRRRKRLGAHGMGMDSQNIPIDTELNPQLMKDKVVIERESATPYATNQGGLVPVVKGDGSAITPSMQPSSGANGSTGLIALDTENDFDAPDSRVFDLKYSNASGGVSDKTKKIIIGSVIGIGVAVLSIWALKKYKVI